jgi:hypothetical protein
MPNSKQNQPYNDVSKLVLKKIQSDAFNKYVDELNNDEVFKQAYRAYLNNNQFDENILDEKYKKDVERAAIAKIHDRYSPKSFLRKTGELFIDNKELNNPKNFMSSLNKTDRALANQNIEGNQLPENYNEIRQNYIDSVEKSAEEEAARFMKRYNEKNGSSNYIHPPTSYYPDFPNSKAIEEQYNSIINRPAKEWYDEESDKEEIKKNKERLFQIKKTLKYKTPASSLPPNSNNDPSSILNIR